MKNIPTKAALALLEDSKFSKIEQIYQLKGLVNDFGYLGAIQYLQPLEHYWSGRDQRLADMHKNLLLSLKTN